MTQGPIFSRRTLLGVAASAAVVATGPRPSTDNAQTSARLAGGRGKLSGPLSGPLRTIDKPGLVVGSDPVATITGNSVRVRFFQATWDTGETILRELSVRVADQWEPINDSNALFDEQWLVLTGDDGNPLDYYSTMQAHWVGFEQLNQVDSKTVDLVAAATPEFDLTVRWNISGDMPTVQWTLESHAEQNCVVGYQCYDVNDEGDIDEVLCGTLQHARVIRDVSSLGAWELQAPMTLIQLDFDGNPLTVGTYIPASVMEFEHLREIGANRQPFGMSLRNGERQVQPVVFAPQFGERSHLQPGAAATYTFGIYAAVKTLPDAYTELARNEYGYTAYRQNIYDTSLTQTMFNLIDLLMVDPDGDDSEDFVPSVNGWWRPAKAWVDTEHDQAVRCSVTGTMLSAYYLTGDPSIYQRRARQLVEFHTSRTGIAWTPKKNVSVAGNAKPHELGSVAGDSCNLVPLQRMMRGQSAALHHLALQAVRSPRGGSGRTPMSAPLQGYELTGNPAYLAEALAVARRYIREEIDPAYTTNVTEINFSYSYSKAWTELLMVYEKTGSQDILEAAHREAQRFITQAQVRPVPTGKPGKSRPHPIRGRAFRRTQQRDHVTVPNYPVFDQQANAWTTDLLWDYPHGAQDVPAESVPKWMVSTNGLPFEGLTTLKTATGGGYTLNAIWAPFLLKLGHLTGDALIRDVAHNAVIGRFTNYPGYYSRQFITWNMRPEYPLQGPPTLSCFYFHHIPAQLGLTIDYLFTEHHVRSAGAIDFPSQFETNFVYFKHRAPGYAPGAFYGDNQVWPYMPKGIIDVSNPQLNWLTGEGNGSLYLSMTNESDQSETAVIKFDAALSGMDPGQKYQVRVIADNGQPTIKTIKSNTFTVAVSAKGITALIVSGVDLDIPLHRTPPPADRRADSYFFDDSSPLGAARAMLLVRPDRSGYDAFVNLNSPDRCTLKYSFDGGASWTTVQAPPHANEWTVGSDSLIQQFTYQLINGTLSTSEHSLALPPSQTGINPAGQLVHGELFAPADTTPGDQIEVTVDVRNETSGPLTNPTAVLGLPAGWSSTATGTPGGAVASGATARWAFKVTLPAKATVTTATLTGTASWDGGQVALNPIDVEVLRPYKVTAIRANPATIKNPGESTTLMVAVLNLGPVPITGALTIDIPAGWAMTPSQATYNVPARSEVEYSFTLTSPASAARETSYRVTPRLNAWYQGFLDILIAAEGVIVNDADPWPRYVETGTWTPSGLAGLVGTTRFSATVGSTATWRPVIEEAGSYEVAISYPTNPETTTAAVYTVNHANGQTQVTVDQQDQALQWRTLGTYDFNAGEDGYVTLQVVNSGYHRADAARFKKTS